MILFVGCEIGQRYEFSKSRGVLAVLDLTFDGEAIVGRQSMALRGNLLVLWHLGEVETFHGFYNPAEFADAPRPTWAGVDVHGFYTCCRRAKPVGLMSESSSGQVQAVAAVVEIPAAGLLYVTSGRYGGRPWMVHTVTATGVVHETLKDYRARVIFAEGV